MLKTNSCKPATIKLDPVGHLYSLISNNKNAGTHGIAVNLKQTVDVNRLQYAVDVLVARLPHLNVRIKKGFFWYKHEALPFNLKVQCADNYAHPLTPFKKGNNHLLRVLYREKQIVTEVLHTVCDGRAITMITSELLTLYFGAEPGGIDLEESENAFNRYADYKNKGELLNNPKSLSISGTPLKNAACKIISRTFNLTKVKIKAKEHGLTVSEYLLTHIFYAVLKEQSNAKHPVSAMVPIDCRTFFPSKIKRNFVTFKNVSVRADNFYEIAAGVKKQFKQIDKNLVMGNINTCQRMIKAMGFIPLCLKICFTRLLYGMGADFTTILSNVGLVKLPLQIEEQIENLEFRLGPEPHSSYQFSCIGIGNALTFSATLMVEEEELFEKIVEAIEGF